MRQQLNTPKGWENVLIPEVMFFQEGPGVRKWQFRDKGVKLLNVGNINNQELNLSTTKIFIDEDEANGKYSHFLLNAGELVIGCSGIVVDNFHNKIAYVSEEDLPLCLNTSTMRFRPLNDNVSLDYFRYFIQTNLFKKQLQRLITGSAQLNFGPSHVKQIELLLPPLTTQRRIAEVLDKADAIRKRSKKILEKYDQLAQSVFLEMFGDISNNIKFQICNVGEVVSIVRDGPHVSPKYSEESDGVPILSTRNIRPFRLILDEVKYVSRETFALLTKRFKPQVGDVLLTKGGTTGYAKVVDFDWEFCIWVHVAALRPIQDKINPKYLEAALNSHFGYQQSQRFTRGIANRDLGLTRMVNIKIPLPAMAIQNKFSSIMGQIEQQKAQTQAELDRAEMLYQSLLQRAFTGELFSEETTKELQNA